MSRDTHTIYVKALKHTHALEMQALQIMERQIERLLHYPEMEAALRQHIAETQDQRQRLEDALRRVSEAPAPPKRGVLGFVDDLIALAYRPAQDAILRNAYANHAFENFEIAAYEALLAIAEEDGHSAELAGFRQSLHEEEDMARKIHDLVRPMAFRYVELTTAGAKVRH